MFNILDAILIAPYRLLPNSTAAFYLGTAVLALACLLVGRITFDLVWLFNRKHYTKEEAEMVRMHNLSVAAIEARDKVAYKAANKEANEAFGKSFFAGAALFSVSIWPLPFVLAWLSMRFTDIDIPLFPGYFVRYNAVFLGLYLIFRLVMWSFWRYLPLFGRVERLRREVAAKRVRLRPWTELGKPQEAQTADSQPDKS
ncbi:conserved hypothetical protein [Solidesulfovibrio fructosivorans JJ]]|uniref:Transmembrane protein n=1 Tax=Solidesulfovibrio fructosivorans JJ] TaxID=596151 RepID=E1JS96_SOLFR|nr:hypothetical protein [Solidesulfovibrio fructosivorans]EFL52865.1 conserved hypothetical protein [Solidesulfovibrio fructosivorans JJ]]